MPDDADNELREAFADADSMTHSGYTREQIWDATGIDYGPTPNGDSPTAADTIRRARAHERTQLNPRSATARFAHRRAAAHKQALQDSEIENPAEAGEAPLSADELAARRALGAELNPAQIAADAEYMAGEMLVAIDGAEDDEDFIENKKGMYRETCRAKNKTECSTHGLKGLTKRYKAASGAARQVMESGKDFPAAVEVPGLGKINFLYGRPGTHKMNENGATHEDGYGLSHIEDKHGTRALHRMPYVLAHGKVEPSPDASKRVIRHGSEIAIVKEGQQGRWILVTSYDVNKNSHRDDLGISTTTEEERKARK